MKIAFVHQPWNDPTPPIRGGSIPIWIDRVARELASRCEVAVIGTGRGRRVERDRDGGVDYVRLPARLTRAECDFIAEALIAAAETVMGTPRAYGT